MQTKPNRILVVDDDAFIREMLAEILQSGGYETVTAEDGAGALEVFERDRSLDLIVSDMVMPGLDGLGLIREIRKRDEDIPIVILTGNNEISVAIQAIHSGANDYLLKDENIQDTVHFSVSKVLEKYHLKQQNVRLMEDLARKNDRLEKDRLLAQKVQKNILPRNLVFPGFAVGSFYEASDKIGGDFFDAWAVGDTIHIITGDVSGHSTSSALIMAVSKGVLRSLGQAQTDPREIVATANRMLCDILGDSGMFISLVYGIVYPADGEIEILSAGHNPIFLFGGGPVETVAAMGPVIGWDPDDTWVSERRPFGRGRGLFLYTDGLTEAKNASGEEFGEDGLLRLVSPGGAPEALIETVYREVASFCGGEFADDLTMFAMVCDKEG